MATITINLATADLVTSVEIRNWRIAISRIPETGYFTEVAKCGARCSLVTGPFDSTLGAANFAKDDIKIICS